jgi:hypothetical protein
MGTLFWEGNSCSCTVEISCLLWNPNYHFCKCLPLASILRHMNPTHNLTLYFFKTLFNIILSFTLISSKCSFSFTFYGKCTKGTVSYKLCQHMWKETFSEVVNSRRLLTAFWDVMPCSLAESYVCFGETHWFPSYMPQPEDTNLYIHSYEKYCQLRFLGGTLQLHKVPAHITAVQLDNTSDSLTSEVPMAIMLALSIIRN